MLNLFSLFHLVQNLSPRNGASHLDYFEMPSKADLLGDCLLVKLTINIRHHNVPTKLAPKVSFHTQLYTRKNNTKLENNTDSHILLVTFTRHVEAKIRENPAWGGEMGISPTPSLVSIING